jgi:hypothetical protein
MNPEDMFDALSSQSITDSNEGMEAYWDKERQRLLAEQEAGTLDPNLINEEGKIETDSAGLNQYLRAEEERELNSPDIIDVAQQQQAVGYDSDPDNKRGDITNHPHFKELYRGYDFDPNEIRSDHPNHEAIYGDTPTWSWGQAILGPLFTGQADSKMELYKNRKHMFTSGTGKADLATNLQETQNMVTGSAFQIVDGLLKLPETVGASVTAPITKMGPWNEKYKYKFDPLGAIGLEDPWTGTSLGSVGKAIGSFAIPGAAGPSLLSKLSKVNKLGRVAKYLGGMSKTRQAMLVDGLWMQVSNYRFEENTANFLQGLPVIRDNATFVAALDLIAIDEDDSPLVKQLKNTLEAVGMVGLFAKLGGIAKSRYRAYKKFHEVDFSKLQETDIGRIVNNLAEQTEEMGRSQLLGESIEFKTNNIFKGSRFRAAKNSVVAGAGQGNIISTNTPGNIFRQLNKIDDLGGLGSTDAVITARQAELAMKSSEFLPEFLRAQAKTMLGEPYVQGLMRDAKAQGLTFEQAFEPAFRRFQEVIGGDASRMSVEDFWGPIQKSLKDGGLPADSLEYVVATDLVNQALFKEIRDLGVMGREINKITDIFATDGVMKTIGEKLVVGLSNVKRARYLISSEYRSLRGAQAAAALAERTALLHDETVDGVRLMMQFLRGSDSDELAQGILEVFSMSNKIKNFKDFDNWMRQKLVGGDFANKTKKGVLMQELGAVMVNSILSSPKTPLRAIMGTTANSYLNEVATLFGATIRRPFTGDVAAMRAAAASTHAMFDLIPDAWKIFKVNLDANFSGELSNIKSRYSSYTKGDTNFKLLGKWAEKHGTDGDKAAFYLANAARNANSNKLFTWSTRVMGATDDTFRWLLSKARARKKAIENIMLEAGEDIKIDKSMLAKAEDIEFQRLHNQDGALDITKDAFLERNYKEVTLTTELQGFTKGLDELMNRYPLTKPFFLFARTGINGLKMSVKNLPIVGAIIDESRTILGATPKMAKEGHLLKYGIENASDLASAKSLIIGRQAIGSMVVYGVAQKYMAGGITGNGPADASMRQMWIDSGWQPRSIKIGDAWVSYDSFEPFNLVMANIADIGDNMNLMGPQFSEERLQLIVAALGKSVTSKTYLQGVGQLFDLLGGQSGYNGSRLIANLVNNQIPLAAMRNDIGKVLNPQMRELGSNFFSHVANRNPILKGTLPIKYDMLNGKPLRSYNFFTNAFNAVSPVQLNMDKGPGRSFLFQSGYDLRLFAYTAPDGTSLAQYPTVRSKFQQSIGKYNLEAKLNELAERYDIKLSMQKMKEDQLSGDYERNPMKAYRHNKILAALFRSIAKRAWADLRNDPEVKALIEDRIRLIKKNRTSLRDTRNLMSIPK